MCQYALYSYPCGHSKLLQIQACETRNQTIQLTSQLDETLPGIPTPAKKITHHYLDEGTPIATAALAAATPQEIALMTCKNPSCHNGFTFDTAMTIATRLTMAIATINTTYNELHDRWLSAHHALRKFQMLATAKYLAVRRPRLKRRLEEHKKWARGLVGVEKRLQEAERVLYRSLGDVEGLKRGVVMSREWKGVVRGVHHARVGLGMLRWEIEGNECW